MGLAIFDLDNTLLCGDSDHAWGEFLISKKLVDPQVHAEANNEFYRHYTEGSLNIDDYVRFTLGPVLKTPISELQTLHETFMEEFVFPMFLPKAQKLIAQHKSAGDYCLIMSATNSFITKPIADALEVDSILSTDLVVKNEFYTGEIAGIPCFQDGKVQRLRQWLVETNQSFNLQQSTFYSDSVNDLPLLKEVGVAIAVDPDKKLRHFAQANNWQIISLRE